MAEGERLPRWARPSLIVRDGQSMRFQYAGRIKAGDYVYMFIAPRYTRLLDRLFASPTKVEADDKDFFGEFRINPRRPLVALKDAYDAQIGPNVSLEKTIGDYMRERLGGTAEIGDRVAIGALELIVREVDIEGEVSEAGLAIDQDAQKARVPVFMSGRELKAFVRAKLNERRTKKTSRKIEAQRAAEPAADRSQD